ncbi:PAS domain-containing protein [Streptomyces sp. AcE210]|uniref:PAS domain-containing protein n=1 Tax=Streptomyces sp. AcE210 TaxID=2292703 RepID=UPI000E30023C|nr:PAS domain-containing protein [Streptomyces sp. AcE210]RFC77545.1 PAS domain-containing protein [Streptomyces sp. AcE210]
MLDAEGAVVGWTHAAEQLVGYSAGEAASRSAAHVLPPAEHAPSASAFAEQCPGWLVRHRDGPPPRRPRHQIDAAKVAAVGQGGGTRWLVSVTDT